jgi:alpha-tubulin suppressor-like RCC1 family protein
VKCLYSNLRSFAALRHDGRVVTWGCDIAGGNSAMAADFNHQQKGISWGFNGI